MRCAWTICLLLLTASLQAAPSSPVTTYALMTGRLKADAHKSAFVRVVSLGKSAGGQRDLWLVRLSDPTADTGQTMRLLVLCRQHGDEPASTEAILRLIHGIATGGDPALRSALSHVTLYLIPMVNPDGAGAGTRVNAKGADLNRDWGIFQQPETRAVARAVDLIHPALIVDAHNWDGNDEYNADCIEIPREMESPRGRAAHAMQQQAVRDLAACGYAVHPTAWGDDSDPHLAHRWFTHQNITSLLVETHSGSPTDRADFERRQGMYTALIHSLVRHSAAPWTRQTSRSTQEASLFPLPIIPGRATLLLHPVPAPRWLWGFTVYALVLGGISLRRSLIAVRRAREMPTPAVRYTYKRKRDKPDTAVEASQAAVKPDLPPARRTLRDPSPAAAPPPVHRPARRSSSRLASSGRHPL